VNTFDALDRWLAAGQISTQQHAFLEALARRQRLSVFLELNALLYLGVLAFIAGLAWTANVYSARWGDAAVLVPATALLVVCLVYCFSRVGPYSHQKVEAVHFVVDYALYLACLTFAVELGYVEYRFRLLQAQWDYYLLASALVYLLLAYRFDNRFVLSLGIATLGGWFGVRLSEWEPFVGAALRPAALTYGALVALLGASLHRAGIKPHFLDTYLHVSANVVLATLASGALAGRVSSVWALALLAVSGAAIAGGVHFRRFAFVAYGVIYGYLGVSRILLRGVGSFTGTLFYVVVSAAAVVVGLVVLSRQFGRDE
jgi:hypothetical protein